MAGSSLQLFEIERDHQSGPQTHDRLRVELASPSAERLLRDREQVVAVHDAFTRKSVLWPERYFRWKASDRSGDGRHRNVGQYRNGAVPRDYDDRPSRRAEIDVIDPATVQSGTPPSASSNAAKPARPSSPTHASCGCFV